VIGRAILAAVLLAPAAAQAMPETGPGLHYLEWLERNERSADPTPSEFKLISYFFLRTSVTNQLGDPTGLRGVSLGPIGVGENVGSGTRTGDNSETFYVEQRWIPVLSYSPNFIDGLATVRAQFEIDFQWGLAANQLQHNQGGGFNADQVNLQTKNLNVALFPTRNPYKLAIVLGAQSLYDTLYDPATTSLFELVKTGYKLSFLGTDATGVAAYGRMYGIWKASFIPIGSAQPDKATDNDARLAYAWLATADYAYPIAPGTVAGVSAWWLQDDTKGAAFAYEGLVKSGPSSTSLSPYTGTARFNIEQPSGHVAFLGAHFHHNVAFRTGDFGASGFVMVNVGRFESQVADTQLLPAVDVLGAAANLELMFNWGPYDGDVITLEGMLTSGDGDLTDGKYSSVFTLNYYGLPGAVWFNHKTLLLFPFTQTVSNYTGAVTDISNRGYGVMAAIASAAWDVVPNKLNLKLGAAFAQSAVAPPAGEFGLARGKTLGAEINAELKYTIRYLMTLGLHAGYLAVGNFFNANPQVAANPWAVFTTFTWYAF
jgi:hypothetical protein